MNNDKINLHLFDILDEIKPVAERDPKAAVRGRAQFLTEAISLREKQRHSDWTIFPNKENFAMNIILSTLVIVGLLFGGSATVAAAQDDLPNQPLYQVKLLSEEMHLWFTSDPVQQIDLLMEQEQARIQEIQRLASAGILPPEEVMVCAQEHIQHALQLAVQLDQESQPPVLQRIRSQLQSQEQQMLQLEQGTCTQCIPILQQTREMLQLQLRDLESDLIDPATLQYQNQNQNRNQTQEQNQLQINQPPQGTGTDTSSCGNCTPAMDGTGQQNGTSPSEATPVQQQNRIQENNQNGGGSPTGSGGQGGKP